MPDIGTLGYWSTIQKMYHDQYRCSGMLFQVLRVEGALTPTIVLKALHRLQQRHPLLRARVVEGDRYFRFEVALQNHGESDVTLDNVPLHVVNREDDSQWQRILEDELSRDFDPESRGLWRTIFLHSEDRRDCAELVNFFHHSLSDGASTTRFAHDLLFLCGRIAEGKEDIPDWGTLPLLPAAEWMVPGISPPPKPAGRALGKPSAERNRASCDFEGYKPLKERRARNLFFQIPERDMATLKARCEQERTTVSNAFTAALLLSSFPKLDSPHSVPFTFAIDLRGYCEPKVTNEHFGCFIMMEQAALTLSKGIPFWDLVRDCGQELTNRVVSGHKRGFMPREFHKTLLRLLLEGNLAKADDRKQFVGGPCLSNLGVLDLSAEYGPFKLKEIYFSSPHLSGLYSVFLCVATLRGRLFCALSYADPLLSRKTAESIADSFLSRLKTACKGT